MQQMILEIIVLRDSFINMKNISSFLHNDSHSFAKHNIKTLRHEGKTKLQSTVISTTELSERLKVNKKNR